MQGGVKIGCNTVTAVPALAGSCLEPDAGGGEGRVSGTTVTAIIALLGSCLESPLGTLGDGSLSLIYASPPCMPQVVTKLFHIVEPDVAVFGRKDYQQWRIISRMVGPRVG